MKQVLVKVDWASPEQGGRSALPSGGDEYVGVSTFDETAIQAWSMRIKWVDKESEPSVWYGLASFLFDEAPYHLLYVGNSFDLIEGRKTVARTSVISSAKVVEAIVKLALAA